MNRKIVFIAIFMCLFSMSCFVLSCSADTSTHNISVMVNGAFTVTDDTNDTVAGLNPIINTNINVTPDVGASLAVGSAGFRVRTNYSMWQLSAQRSGFVDGGTQLAASDVSFLISKLAGSNANVNACALQAPFTGLTNLGQISDSSATVICGGSTSKRAVAVSTSANANNYLRFVLMYLVQQDFYYEPGTASDTITFTLTNI